MQDSILVPPSAPVADPVVTVDTAIVAVDSTVIQAAEVVALPLPLWLVAPLVLIGALGFGAVVGWVTYRTIRRSETSGLPDIAAVIGAVGGAAVTALFPAGTAAFGAYGIGLAIGFFSYYRAYRKTYGLDAIRANPSDHNILGQPEHTGPAATGGGPVNPTIPDS